MSRTEQRGLYLALDGVLAESQAAMQRAFADFAEQFGHQVSAGDFASLSGPPVPILVATLKRCWALPQKLDELIHAYNGRIDSAFLEIPATPGAAATLEAAFGRGFKVGVVTSNASARARLWLARQGLMKFVDVVVGGDDVCLGKPDPEPYLMALARSRCLRQYSIAVEDSPQGARSALAAGLRVFGYVHGDQAAAEWPDSVRLISAIDELVPEVTRARLRRAGALR